MIQGREIYLLPGETVYAVMRYLKEMQCGNAGPNDEKLYTLCFTVRMFGEEWGLRFSATDMDKRRCAVTLEIFAAKPGEGDPKSCEITAENILKCEFAMLNAMLCAGAPFEPAYAEGGVSLE